MHTYTDIVTNNTFSTKDYTYQNLKEIVRDKCLVLLNRGKDPSVVVITELIVISCKKMNDDEIKNKIYEETTESTLKDLETL